MPSSWPTSIDNFGHVTGSEITGSPNGSGLTHSGLHNLLADAVGQLETTMQLYGQAYGSSTPSGSSLIGETPSGATPGNLAFGYQALGITVGGSLDTSTATYDVAIGYQSLMNDTSGPNIAIGYQAMTTNNYGYDSVGIGYQALQNGIHPSRDIAIGSYALQNDATPSGGGQNIAIGYSAMQSNTTGYNNVAIGHEALSLSQDALSNVAVGSLSMLHNLHGYQNVAVGGNSLTQNATGNNNVAIGYNANETITANNYTLALGAFTSATADGSVAIGTDSSGTGAASATPNYIILGTVNHTANVPGILQTANKQVSTIIESINTVAASGTAQTIPDVLIDTMNEIVLTANCTLTFPTAAAGKSFILALTQDATGSRTVTWPANIKWSGGTTPTLTTTINKTDTFSFICFDGTNWIGYNTGLNF